ncbi:MAG: T9SS type A sorting domain-containing protein [Flavobacteriales bacterium]|jgi:hypothetical protein|nr:T9SS type A sorting domain-containing protein [Flavobacteriales bacterium]
MKMFWTRRITVAALSVVLIAEMGTAQTTWRRAFGALGPDEGRSVRTMANGHIVVAGSTGSFGAGTSDIYLLELNGDGELQWSYTIGGPMIEQASSLLAMQDGGWLIIGSTNDESGTGGYDGQLTRTDALGTVEWQHTYGGTSWDFFHGGAAMPDGGAIICGETFSEGLGGDAWLVRTNASGDTIWTKHFGGAGSDLANSVISTSDGGIAFAGATTGTDGNENAYVLKFDALENLQWMQSYGGDSLDFGRDILQTQDGGFSIVGATRSFSQWVEHYHFKVDAIGVLQWEKHWGQVGDQEAYQHIQMSSGEFVTTGWTTTSGGGGKDMFIFLCDGQGDFIAQHTFGGAEDDEGFSLDTIAGGFVACGVTSSYGAGSNDVFVVRTDSNANTATEIVTTYFDPLSIPTPGTSSKPIIYPNPTYGPVLLSNPEVWQRVALFDAIGRTLHTWKPPYAEIEISDLQNGTYFLRCTDRSGQVTSSPLILQKH